MCLFDVVKFLSHSSYPDECAFEWQQVEEVVVVVVVHHVRERVVGLWQEWQLIFLFFCILSFIVCLNFLTIILN